MKGHEKCILTRIFSNRAIFKALFLKKKKKESQCDSQGKKPHNHESEAKDKNKNNEDLKIRPSNLKCRRKMAPSLSTSEAAGQRVR